MSDRVKKKSRVTEHSLGRLRKKKKTLKKRSSSSSEDCVIVTAAKSTQRNSCGKEMKRKSRKKKRHRSSSSDSRSSDSSHSRSKIGTKPKQLLGERPEFCRNTMRYRVNSRNGEAPQENHYRSGANSEQREKLHASNFNSKQLCSIIEKRLLNLPKEERGRKRVRDLVDGPSHAKISKKSRKRRKSSSRSSSTSNSSRSSSTSSTSSTSTSSSSSYERRKRQRKKKKLAKRIKHELKRRQKEEKRRIMKKKLKEKSRESVRVMKRAIVETPQDRLLKDINVELADRARAMAPMTKEQWEKKQSVVRRVYDSETGRQRLIKGDGEILEEIVSRDRHMAINRQATKGDGEFFQSRLTVKK